MTTDPLPPLSILLDTRDKLRSDVRARMSAQARTFLVGFFNLAIFQRQRPDDFIRQLDQLTKALD